MNTKQVAINWGLVFNGRLFKTPNACGRYKGTVTAKRPQWLKDHPMTLPPSRYDCEGRGRRQNGRHQARRRLEL